MFLVIICLKKQRIFFTSLVIKKKVITTKSLALSEIRAYSLNLQTIDLLKNYLETYITKRFTIEEEERVQHEFDTALTAFKKKNNPKNPEYIKEKVNFLDSAKKFCDGRDMIINAFQDKIYKIYHEENMFEVEDNIRNEN